MAYFFHFAILQSVVVGVALVFVWFTPQYNVTLTDASSKYVASCHWDKGILYDDDGHTVCISRNFFFGCRELMKNINSKSNGCVPFKGSIFSQYTQDLDVYTEQVTYNIIEMTVSVGLGLVMVWLLPRFVRRRRTSVYNLMVIFHGVALIFALIYAINANYAMDRLSKNDNYHEGQRVTIGLGFFAVLFLPIALLSLDLFIEDWA